MSERFKTELSKEIKGKVVFNEPLAKHTCLKIGGPCEAWIEPEGLDDLKATVIIAQRHRKPIFVIGGGSNVLISDRGFKGIVIHLGRPFFKEICFENGEVSAGAGAPLPLLISFSLSKGFGGFECLLGIPANVGGAVAMNAGSHREAIGTFVKEIETINVKGDEETLGIDELEFGYRHSNIGRRIITRVKFRFPKAQKDKVANRLQEYSDYRKKTQDLRHPSAGCAFRNPEGPLSSVALIEQAGLKGKRIGQAQVSTVHANFIVNLGGASSQDVIRLMKLVQKEVNKKHGVRLEPEIRLVAAR